MIWCQYTKDEDQRRPINVCSRQAWLSPVEKSQHFPRRPMGTTPSEKGSRVMSDPSEDMIRLPLHTRRANESTTTFK